MKTIHTDNAPKALGPYSQGIFAGGVLYSAGVIGINPATGELAGDDIASQTEQVMKNLGAILEEAGLDYSKIVKTNCYLTDMADFAAFNEVYAKYITTKPARSTVSVVGMAKNALVEIDVIAVAE